MIKNWFKKPPSDASRTEAELFDNTPVFPVQQGERTSYVNRCSFDDLGSAEAIINAARSVN
ncbi:hypothetical protein [Govanella unica]|uniref:Uncharacterized protein n=1 Tax=Govanella unica TaxID=2975056 RepID=A0A9X3TZF8_9PROT|nr:hypothetical protein [Govania unica]MDA5194272.1 hypothetical protein [Govania unica]